MTSGQEFVLAAKLTSLALLLLLLLFNGGYRSCYSFPVYLLGVLLPDLGLAADPSLFNWNTWIAIEALHAVLKFTLAAELGWRLFAVLPGARGTLAAGLLLVTAVTLAAVVGAPLSAPAHVVAQTALAPVLHGTAWIFGAIQAAKLYYRIPAHPLHTAILRGLVPFLLTFTVALGLLRDIRSGRALVGRLRVHSGLSGPVVVLDRRGVAAARDPEGAATGAAHAPALALIR